MRSLTARRPKLLRQARSTAACPAQWTGRIAAGDRIHQLLKSGQKPCAVSGFLPPPGLRTGSSSGSRSSSLIPDGRSRHSCRLCDPRDAATSDRTRLHRRPTATRSLVEQRLERNELGLHHLRHGMFHDMEYSISARQNNHFILAGFLTLLPSLPPTSSASAVGPRETLQSAAGATVGTRSFFVSSAQAVRAVGQGHRHQLRRLGRERQPRAAPFRPPNNRHGADALSR